MKQRSEPIFRFSLFLFAVAVTILAMVSYS